MTNIKWRFPASNHGERKGISSGDTEAFKKSPFQAFAREVLQNSIDARATDEEPTVVEFMEFDINTNEKIKFPHISTISGECFCWITTFDGKVIRQSFVDENNKQYRYC